MLFFLAAGLLTLIVAAALVRPLLKPLAPPPPAGRYNAAVYRDQLDELRRETERQGLAPEDAAAARLEIERRLLAAARETAPDAPPQGASVPPSPVRASPALALGVVAVLFLGGGGLYLSLGHPLAGDEPLAPRIAQARADGGGQNGGGQDDMARLVDLLAKRLAADPNHPDGWALLARSELQMGRIREALDAYARALAMSPQPDTALGAQYAEAQVIAADGRVTPQAAALFKARLAAAPGDPQARYYLALAKAQAGDVEGALADWRALEASAPARAPWLPTLRRRIAEAGARTARAGAPAPAR